MSGRVQQLAVPASSRRTWLGRVWQASATLMLTGSLSVGLGLGLSGCGRKSTPPPPPAAAASKAEIDNPSAFRILAGSELKDVAPALEAAAQQAGVAVRFDYAGTLDIVERVNAGGPYDAILPPNGAYPSLALSTKPLARDKLFYSRVALGVKQSKAHELGWDARPPTWAEIAAAVQAGKLRYGMTNPTSSNTGMSALFAVASAVAGKTEDLSAADVNAPNNVATIKAFLTGQKLTAGSSGWLADAYVKEQGQLDGLINYEAMLLRLNTRSEVSDKLALIYPKDGVITADYPLMLLAEPKRADYLKLVEAWKALPFQNEALAAAFLRPSHPDAKPAPELPRQGVSELNFPNRLDVIDAVLLAYQGDWRRPATSIFVIDTSGSMKGERITDLRTALKVLSGADTTSLTARYARFQSRERAVLISFSSETRPPEVFDFGGALPDDPARERLRRYADALEADGGTAIYSSLVEAYRVARQELQDHPDRIVTIALLTDGLNNQGMEVPEFDRVVGAGAQVRIFPILFGEASTPAMEHIAQISGGRVFDGKKAALSTVFKDIRGYQ